MPSVAMPSQLESLNRWVDEVARLTRPDAIHWCDGSDAENAALTARMVADGTLLPLNPDTHPGCHLHRSHPADVARVVGLLGGLPIESGAQTINRFCSSGLQAIAIAAGAVAFGSNELVIAGGVESMSMVPMTGNKLSVSPEAMERCAGA